MTKADIKKYHKQFALKDNCIGQVHCWNFKNVFLFLNFEKGIVEEVKTPDCFTITDRTEFDKLYKERNIHEGSERERTYGKVHETFLKVWTEGTDGKGMYSSDFIRDLSYMHANIETHKDLVKAKLPFEPLKCSEEQLSEYREIVKKHHLSMDDTYGKMCNKGFDNSFTKKEIKKIVSDFKKLPEFWQKNAMKHSEEMKVFLVE